MHQPNQTHRAHRAHRTLLTAAGSIVLLAALAFAPAYAQSKDTVFKDQAALLETDSLSDMVLGDADAPVTIIEYASMTCPHCANFHSQILPKLQEQYIDTGKVRLIFREFPLDRLAVAASMLARCAGDDKFFPLVSLMFAERRKWITEDPIEALKKLVKQAGLTEEAFDKCLANQKLLDGIVWIQDRAKSEFEVGGTPTLFVNGEKVSGGQALGGDLDEIIKRHLGG